MTNGDVFIQILSEVTGQPEENVGFLVELAKKHNPHHGFDKELTPDEAQEMLQALRKEKNGIIQWLAQGYEQAITTLGRL